MSKYYPPKHNEKAFHCPICGVYASQSWHDLGAWVGGKVIEVPFQVAWCGHCSNVSLWHEERLILPPDSAVEHAHPDLPEDCSDDYNEAREVFSWSPRSAAALLRLCIQKLMPHLGESGKNINQDIGELVKKGLSPGIQQALDVCRVVGNNAVHPGEIDVNDSPELTQKLFPLINMIVEDRITKPKEIEKLYNSLPEGARKAIEKRDGEKPS